MLKKLMGAALAALILAALAVAPALAAEKGKFKGKAVLKSVSATSVKTADGHPGAALMVGEDDGVIFNENGSEFLDNARYQVTWSANGAGKVTGCYKTFTAANGDKVYAECFGAFNADGKGAVGTVKLVGGTGKYQGIRGDGTFKVAVVSPGLVWDILEWSYETP